MAGSFSVNPNFLAVAHQTKRLLCAAKRFSLAKRNKCKMFPLRRCQYLYLLLTITKQKFEIILVTFITAYENMKVISN